MHMINIRRAFAGIGAGLAILAFSLTPSAQAAPRPHGDCTLVAKADRALCTTVRAQKAFGWTDEVGLPQNWNAAGPSLVHDITHQGYSKREMHDALKAAHRDYRDYVTDVSFSMPNLIKRCGHTHGAYGLQYIQGDDGNLYTWKQIICD